MSTYVSYRIRNLLWSGTYEVGLFDGGSLKDQSDSTELTDNISFVQLVDIRSNVIGLAEIEVDMLLGHSLVHF